MSKDSSATCNRREMVEVATELEMKEPTGYLIPEPREINFTSRLTVYVRV